MSDRRFALACLGGVAGFFGCVAVAGRFADPFFNSSVGVLAALYCVCAVVTGARAAAAILVRWRARRGEPIGAQDVIV